MAHKRIVDCRFEVRSVVAVCGHCGFTVIHKDEQEFNEAEYAVSPGTVLSCEHCNGRFRITNPGRIFDKKLRGVLE